MSVPYTRTLPFVLREALDTRWAALRAGKVLAVPDAEHVTVDIGGASVTIPRLSSYTPTIGEGVQILADENLGLLLALGAVGGTAGGGGTPGAPGSKWYSGSGAPAGSLGIVGDWYLNDANGDVYEKTGASAWTLRDNLTGPQGPAGATGPQGPQGVPGPSGASTFVSGSGAPTAGVGVDGSIYLDTASGRLWGPKASGTWPGTAFARAVPLTPTYAQLKAG